MKILVLSDSHRASAYAEKALSAHPTAEVVIFLGDGEGDILPHMRQPQQAFAAVRGNCDLCSTLPLTRVFDLQGIRFFCAHGHTYHVKSTLVYLKTAARTENASVALFGHTHTPFLAEENGLLLFNPGSLRSGDYGLLELRNGVIRAFHKQL